MILAGEHAAVYGYPALVATLGLRATIEIEAASGHVPRDVELLLEDLGRRSRHDWPSIERFADESRRAWQRFDDGARFEPVAADAGAAEALVLVALGESRRVFGAGPEHGTRVRVRSEIPLGSGCGSSAAISLGLVAAYAAWAGADASDEDLEAVALDVERRQHGRPSGVDTAAVLRGGLLWVERGDDSAGRRQDQERGQRGVGQLRVTRLTDRGKIGRRLALYNSGTPDQSTGEVVAAVAERLERGLVARESLDALGENTRRLRDLVVGESCDSADSGQALIDIIRQLESGLESLGVVPDSLIEVARRVEAAGGALKISGAGALSGSGGGLVLVYDPGAGPSADGPAQLGDAGWQRLDVSLDAPGLTVDVG